MPADDRFEIAEFDFAHFEWDEPKRVSNIVKHNIDFRDLIPLFAQTLCRKKSDRKGETRFLVVGVLDVEVSIIYTERQKGVCRIISARRARPEERRAYRALLPRGA